MREGEESICQLILYCKSNQTVKTSFRCVIDTDLVPDLVYNDNLSLVYTNMKAFKFADQVVSLFSVILEIRR